MMPVVGAVPDPVSRAIEAVPTWAVVLVGIVGIAAAYTWVVKQTRIRFDRSLPSVFAILAEWGKTLLLTDKLPWRASQWVGVPSVGWYAYTTDGPLGVRVALAGTAVSALRFAWVGFRRARQVRQMFGIADGVMKYKRGSHHHMRGYIVVHEWVDAVHPGRVSVYYQPKFQSSDERFRGQFEREWSSSVTTRHEWSYVWVETENRVTALPREPLPSPLPYERHETAWNEFPIGMGHDGLAVWDVDRFPHMLIAGPTGTGKALALDTPVPTPDGWLTMGELRVGDRVFDERGRPCRVTEAFDVLHDRTCYEVVFSDGATVVADADHQWTSHTHAARWSAESADHRSGEAARARAEIVARLGSAAAGDDTLVTIPDVAAEVGRSEGWVHAAVKQNGLVPSGKMPRVHERRLGGVAIKRTGRHAALAFPRRELLAACADRATRSRDGLSQHRKRVPPQVVTTEEMRATLLHHSGARNHALPVTDSVGYDATDLPVAPYTLGVWLGDGRNACAVVTTIDPEVLDGIRADGYTVTRHGNAASAVYGVGPGLTSALDVLGVLGDKHIPRAYRVAATEQRLALLQGLMDADGSVGKSGESTYTTGDRALAAHVHELVSSLGVTATLTSRPAKIDGGCVGTSWKVAFTTDLRVARLPRKSGRLPLTVRPTQRYRYVTEVRPVASVPVRCVTVDGAAHQFLVTRAFLPTHNSVIQRVLILHALQEERWRVYGVDPKAVELFWLKGRSGVVEVTSQLESMRDTVERVYQEMLRRQDECTAASRNSYLQLDPVPPALLLVVDEVTEFLSLSKMKTEEAKEEDELRQEVTTRLMSIGRLGRAFGVHLLLATQRPDATSLPGNLKNNLDARYAAGRMDKIPSQMVLDSDAATALPNIKGRGMLKLGGETETIQAFFLAAEAIEEILGPPDGGEVVQDAVRPRGGVSEAEREPVGALPFGDDRLPPAPAPPGPPARPSRPAAEDDEEPSEPELPPAPFDGEEPLDRARPPQRPRRPPPAVPPAVPPRKRPGTPIASGSGPASTRAPVRAKPSDGEDDGKGRPAKRPMNLERIAEILDEIDAMPGLQAVSTQVRSMTKRMTIDIRRREAGQRTYPMNLHLVFAGPPGTGKTVIARKIGEIYVALGLLAKSDVVEVSRRDVVGGYVGHTAEKMGVKLDEAMDGLFFLDEAYSLVQGGDNDFGHEAITELLARMENSRDRMAVVVAGYPNKMTEFIESNPGLRSRFGRTIAFPHYSAETLVEIAGVMLGDADYVLAPAAAEVLERGVERMKTDGGEDFGNAREVRTLLDEAVTVQAGRLADLDADEPEELSTILDIDILRALQVRGMDVSNELVELEQGRSGEGWGGT